MGEQYIEMLRDGSRVTIRAIRPGDEDAQAAFLRGLSAQSKHLLFLGGVAQLRDDELKRLCEPDQVHDMAFVAVADLDDQHTHPDDEHAQVGISRYASAQRPCDEAEISVAVADAWQHKGLATALLRRLITHAREHGVKRLYSVDMATNHRMRRLARHVGFREEPDPDDVHQVIYTMDLDG